MKRINIISIALLIYLVVMSVIGWPGGNSANLTYTEYFCMIGATLVIIALLRFVQIKRFKARSKWKDDNNE